MVTPLDTVPTPPVPALSGDWTVRLADPATDGPATGPTSRATRTCLALLDGEPVALLRIHRVLGHPLRGCYPAGAHDLVLDLTLSGGGPADVESAGRLLRDVVPALFAADSRCRRVIAAPAEDDTSALRLFEAGAFRRVAEADLREGTVVLLAVEPPEITGLSTSLDDMPH
jgi:hypothetical protein